MKHKKDWSTFASVRVMHVSCRIYEFDTLDDAVRHTGWDRIAKCTGQSSLGYYTREIEPFTRHPLHLQLIIGDPVVFYDEMGLIIPIWRIKDAAMALRLHYKPNYWGRWGSWRGAKFSRHYVFRNGPVPNIRCSRGGPSGSAPMRTRQEIRDNLFLDHYDEDAAEYGIKSRPSRRDLPMWWDEGRHRPTDFMCWKNYRRRRHQWR